MAKPVRVHVFGGPRVPDRHLVRVMARCLVDRHDVSAEDLAGTYDMCLGGDDGMVGAHFTAILDQSNDRREYAERCILACDLLRQSHRTKH